MPAFPLRVLHASDLLRQRPDSSDLVRPEVWGLAPFVGRLVELSCSRGAASLTLALHLVYQAQREGEPVAWVSSSESLFFGPDAEAMGIDLSALPVIRAKDVSQGARHVDKLLRSGAFGLVVFDVSGAGFIQTPLMGRLMKLAEKHLARVVFLTRRGDGEPSVGSLVSWRGMANRQRLVEGGFAVEVEVIKDKRRGPGMRHREVYGGPSGLR
jgi:recombination protein RecA